MVENRLAIDGELTAAVVVVGEKHRRKRISWVSGQTDLFDD